ncbi:hypothetical protein CBS101457_002479 [Exobasidium rhododendri]|nr:hypothetical protein CBS101457_002479 [Exobasidium rhododendri]
MQNHYPAFAPESHESGDMPGGNKLALKRSLGNNVASTDLQKRSPMFGPLLAQFSMKAVLNKGKTGASFLKQNPKATAAAGLMLAGFGAFELAKTQLENRKTINVYHHFDPAYYDKDKTPKKRMLSSRKEAVDLLAPLYDGDADDTALAKRDTTSANAQEKEAPFARRVSDLNFALDMLLVGGIGATVLYKHGRSKDDTKNEAVERAKYWQMKAEIERAKSPPLFSNRMHHDHKGTHARVEKGNERRPAGAGIFDESDEDDLVKRDVLPLEDEDAPFTKRMSKAGTYVGMLILGGMAAFWEQQYENKKDEEHRESIERKEYWQRKARKERVRLSALQGIQAHSNIQSGHRGVARRVSSGEEEEEGEALQERETFLPEEKEKPFARRKWLGTLASVALAGVTGRYIYKAADDDHKEKEARTNFYKMNTKLAKASMPDSKDAHQNENDFRKRDLFASADEAPPREVQSMTKRGHKMLGTLVGSLAFVGGSYLGLELINSNDKHRLSVERAKLLEVQTKTEEARQRAFHNGGLFSDEKRKRSEISHSDGQEHGQSFRHEVDEPFEKRISGGHKVLLGTMALGITGTAIFANIRNHQDEHNISKATTKLIKLKTKGEEALLAEAQSINDSDDWNMTKRNEVRSDAGPSKSEKIFPSLPRRTWEADLVRRGDFYVESKPLTGGQKASVAVAGTVLAGLAATAVFNTFRELADEHAQAEAMTKYVKTQKKMEKISLDAMKDGEA